MSAKRAAFWDLALCDLGFPTTPASPAWSALSAERFAIGPNLFTFGVSKELP